MNTFVHLWQYLDELFLDWEMFQTTFFGRNQHTFYVQQLFPENRAVYGIIWENMAKPDRPQITIRRMRFACWVTKAIDIYTQNI
jgi:hypothetical protein